MLNLFKKDRNDVYKKDSAAKLILFTNCQDFNYPNIIDHVVYLGGTVSTDAYKFLNNNSLDIAVDAIVYRYGNLLARLPNHQN